MDHSNFFIKAQDKNKAFYSKLDKAIKIIKENKTPAAQAVSKVIEAKEVIIRPFSELTKKHYLDIKYDPEMGKFDLPEEFPLTKATIKRIETEMVGIIFDDKYIYVCSTKNKTSIAKILVHEITHFLNTSLFEEEKLRSNHKTASFDDEVRAYEAERMFKLGKHRLGEKEIKHIQKKVKKLYPEFSLSQQDTNPSITNNTEGNRPTS